MKDRDYLFQFGCTTRKIFLQHPPAGRNDWHVRFTAPAITEVAKVAFGDTPPFVYLGEKAEQQ